MKQHEATVAGHLRNLKAVRCFIVVLLMFCFAGCAAGSCLSYGHACWGAHGKRSYNGLRVSQHRQIDTRADGRPTGNVEPIDNPTVTNRQNRWFLTHLINRRLAVPATISMVNPHPGDRWNKRRTPPTLSGGWNNYATTSDEIFGGNKNEIDKSIENSKDSDFSLELTRKLTKSRDDITELLGVPSHGEYVHHYPSHTSKLRLYKMLTDSSDDDTL